MPTLDEIAQGMSEEQKKRFFESLPGVAQRIVEEDAQAEAQAEQDRLHKEYKRALAKAVKAGERHKIRELRNQFLQKGYTPRMMTDQETREIQNGREEE